jgi:hypothetical protein
MVTVLSLIRIFEWYERFWDGRSGRSTAVRTPDKIKTVRELISADRRMTLRMMEEELEIRRETFREILMDDLGKRNICARFVPRCLTDERKALRLPACQQFIQSVADDRSLLDSVVAGDETWCFQYDPQTKRQSMEWCSPNSLRHRQFRFQRSKNKLMLVTFFDSRNHSQRISFTRSVDE